ncbi:rhodanese-like domain-containing protein [Desulfobulbus sp. F4]|nr:rhodanese-like domain-containing protein [Desulfobulbus sp. F3]MCW5200786.1 rhodanese-like domain-containing protein [Desulfobulbus sp. F4]
MLLLAAACLMMGSAAAQAADADSGKFAKEVETELSAVKLARETVDGGYGLITSEELKKLIESGKDIVVVDAREYEASYQKEHVPGAKHFLFPVPIMTEWDSKETGGKTLDDYAALLGPDKSKTIVIYCGFVKCTRSHNGAVWAKKLGYTNVLRNPGGFFAWKGANYQIEKPK